MQEQEHTVPAEDAPLGDEELRRVTALGAVTAAGGRHPIHCLTIIGRWRGIIRCRPSIRLPSTSM